MIALYLKSRSMKLLQAGVFFSIICTLVYMYFLSYNHGMITMKYPVSYKVQHVCTNVLERMVDGRWVKKTNLTRKEEESRELFEAEMRIRGGFPANLSLDDQHCGPKHILPKGTKKGFDIPAACDRLGRYPCCNPDKGQCGRDEISCECNSCTDFRHVLLAVFADWLPYDVNCNVKYFTQREACQLLSKHVSTMIFIGDSFVRHIHNAMMILMTGDEARGALHPGITEEMARHCEGEFQFVDAGSGRCHSQIIKGKTSVKKRKFCYGTSTFSYKLLLVNKVSFANQTLSAVNELLGKKNSIVILGIGVHDNYNSASVIKNYLDPIVRLVTNRGNGWPSLLWLGAHSVGFHKPLQYVWKHNMHIALSFNEIMKDYCRNHDIPFFDSIQLTQGVHSFDGSHFGKHVNHMKLQILLNYLKEKFKYQTK